MIDPDALHYLIEQKGVYPVPDGPLPIVVGPPQDGNVTDDEMNHVSNILSVEDPIEEQKHTSIKECFNQNN